MRFKCTSDCQNAFDKLKAILRSESVLLAPNFNNLLVKRMRFKCTSDCQNAFDKLKAILRSESVLLAPNFNNAFKLAVDTTGVGAGGVLLQEDESGVDHPVCYFSKKFNKHQNNYSTVEKECLSRILALQHFEVILCHCPCNGTRWV